MATENMVRRETFVAGEDLRTKQYYAVYMSADRTVKLADGTAASKKKLVGILDNKPNTNEAASVVVHGTTPALLGGTVTYGDYLMVDASGTLVKGAVNWGALASAEESGSAGEIISVFVSRPATAMPTSP